MEKTKNNLYEIGAVISYYEKSATGYESLRKQKFIPVEGLFYDEENKILVFGKDYDETKYNIGTGNDNEFMISRNVVFKGGSKNINEFGDFSYHELFYTKNGKRRCRLTVDMIWDAEIEEPESRKRIFVKNGILWKKTKPDYDLDIDGVKVETRILYNGLIVLKERTKGVDDFGLRGNDFDGDIVLDNGCFRNAEFEELNFYENDKFNMTLNIFALNGNESIKKITWNEEFVSIGHGRLFFQTEGNYGNSHNVKETRYMHQYNFEYEQL